MTPSARIMQISVSPGGGPKRPVPWARVLRAGSLTTGDPVQLLTEDEALALIGPR